MSKFTRTPLTEEEEAAVAAVYRDYQQGAHVRVDPPGICLSRKEVQGRKNEKKERERDLSS